MSKNLPKHKNSKSGIPCNSHNVDFPKNRAAVKNLLFILNFAVKDFFQLRHDRMYDKRKRINIIELTRGMGKIFYSLGGHAPCPQNGKLTLL